MYLCARAWLRAHILKLFLWRQRCRSGLENLRALTSSKQSELRVDLEAVNGTRAYALYRGFRSGDTTNNYFLHFDSFVNGTAGMNIVKYPRSRYKHMKIKDDRIFYYCILQKNIKNKNNNILKIFIFSTISSWKFASWL